MVHIISKLSLIILALFSYSLTASQHQKTQIMILGVYHFSNPGLDVNKVSSFDHLSSKAQKEIAQVNTQLISFNPDKIFLEQDVPRNSVINDRYQKYLNDEFDISEKSNEIYQLGFKVAAKLDLQQVYTIDAPGIFPYEYMQAAIKEFKLDAVTQALKQDSAEHKKQNKANASRTVIERLVSLNRSEAILKGHLFYNDIATRVISKSPTHKLKPKLEITKNTEHMVVPIDPDYIGAELTSEWYKRNIKIFANIYKNVVPGDDKKILLIIGAGHLRILHHLFKDNPNFQVVDTNSILIADRSFANK